MSRRSHSHVGQRWLAFALIAGCCLLPSASSAQGTTGTVIGIVKDGHGAAVPGAIVRVTSPDLIGDARQVTTDDGGQFRFPSLPPGTYAVAVSKPGFVPQIQPGIVIGAGGTRDASATLIVGPVTESVEVSGASSRIDVRESGFATRFGAEDLPGHTDAKSEHVRFNPGNPGIITHLSGQRDSDHGLGVRVRHE